MIYIFGLQKLLPLYSGSSFSHCTVLVGALSGAHIIKSIMMRDIVICAMLSLEVDVDTANNAVVNITDIMLMNTVIK